MRITNDRMRDLLNVYFIMGSINCVKDPREVLQAAIEGGITLFQFREKGTGSLVGEEKYELAKSLQRMCIDSGIPFIINDDVELALAIGADGIHIGQEDEAVEYVRAKMGDKILGVSAHTVEEASLAIKQGADYLGIGPIFSTKTKEDAIKAQGTKLVKKFRETGIHIPLVGIGGIDMSNARSVVEAGADGVSVITAISHSEFPTSSAALLKTTVESVLTTYK